MKSTVSVLIPVHNSESFVGASVCSVLSQDYPKVEVIAIDDSSTDGTRDRLASIVDERFRWCPAKCAGAAAARNQAFSISTGDYILYLDADDLINEQHVSRLLQVLFGFQNCVALGQWDRFYVDPSEAQFPERSSYFDAPGSTWLAHDWLHAKPMVQCGMALIPRQLIERNGGWDERLSLIDDFEFFARIISRSAGVRHAPGARLYYRSGVHGSLSRQKSRKAIESQFLSLILGTGHLLDVEDSPQTRLACANILQSFEYEHFPSHADLRARVRARVAEIGGANLLPTGPPRFEQLEKLVGWKMARRIQRAMKR
jgi:glycosyltransferase involved in cell wall biosynthesis